MSLATAGLFAAKWTQRIELERITNLEELRPTLKGRLETRPDGMREAVPDWEVNEDAWTPLVGNMKLPDPNDQHVLAAAIAGHADCIVTGNLRDFPAEVGSQYGIEVIHPDRFIINQWGLDHIATMTAFKGMLARLRNPKASPEHFAQALERNGLPVTTQRIREAAELI